VIGGHEPISSLVAGLGRSASEEEKLHLMIKNTEKPMIFRRGGLGWREVRTLSAGPPSSHRLDRDPAPENKKAVFLFERRHPFDREDHGLSSKFIVVRELPYYSKRN